MKIRKSDFSVVLEAEGNGSVVAMTSIIERNRTELNKELSEYFRNKVPAYAAIIDEEDADEVLYDINEYLNKRKINKKPIDFPFSSGSSDIHLIPITENLKLKLLVVDEYHGDGDYSKYIDMSYFLINESTTKEDVDELIKFIKQWN